MIKKILQRMFGVEQKSKATVNIEHLNFNITNTVHSVSNVTSNSMKTDSSVRSTSSVITKTDNSVRNEAVTNTTNTINSSCTAVVPLKKLDDELLERTLNYVLLEELEGVRIWRAQTEKKTSGAYLFLVNSRMYIYLHTALTQLQPGVRLAGNIRGNVQLCVITSHAWQYVAENPQEILTNIDKEHVQELTGEEIYASLNLLLNIKKQQEEVVEV